MGNLDVEMPAQAEDHAQAPSPLTPSEEAPASYSRQVAQALEARNDGGNPLKTTEQDICDLMLKNAEAQARIGEMEKKHTSDMEKVLLENIEIIDAFDRVLASIEAKKDLVTPQMEKWIKNFRNIRSRVEQILDANDIKRIELLSNTFDPHWHQVVEMVPDEERESKTICEVVKPGYWHPRTRRILRKIQVNVVS